MRFSQDCLAATLYLVCSLLISQSNNMGDKIMGCASLIGPSWLGAIFGGCVVSPASNDTSHVQLDGQGNVCFVDWALLLDWQRVALHLHSLES